MQTLQEFIAERGITITSVRTTANPNMADDKWAATASHYDCRLRLGTRRMTVRYSMGSAHTNPPMAADVLDSVASESAGVDSHTFEEWCSDFAFVTDSRRAERTYKACARSANSLRRLIGDDTDYRALLFDVERL